MTTLPTTAPPHTHNTHVHNPALHTEFDSNDDGRLELSELRRLCDLVGRALSDDELREAIQLLGGRDKQHVYFVDFAGGVCCWPVVRCVGLWALRGGCMRGRPHAAAASAGAGLNPPLPPPRPRAEWYLGLKPANSAAA